MGSVGAGVEGDVSTFLLVHVAVGESCCHLLQENSLESSTFKESSTIHAFQEPRADAEEGKQCKEGREG